MAVFRDCAQNGMGKIDELEGVFMKSERMGNKIIFGGNAIARK